MTKEDITRMAREAGAMFDHMTWVERDLQPVFERFAALVAEHERAECAKFCAELRKMAIAEEREACRLIVLDNSDSEGICCTDDVLEALRQRGEK